MPLNLDQIPAETRARFIAIGRQFGSSDTLAQAEITLGSFEKFGHALADHGFIASDAARLAEARDALRAALADVAPASARRKQTSHEYVRAMREGKILRQRARSILHIVAQRLVHTADPVQCEAARAVQSALAQTQSSRGDAQQLASQLDHLRAVLTMARVEPLASERGGRSAAPLLALVADKLSAIVQTQTAKADDSDPINLLDGIIVELVRDARRASRSASRALGDPALAASFELINLSCDDDDVRVSFAPS